MQLASSWISTSCKMPRVTPGRIMHSKLFCTNLIQKTSKHKQKKKKKNLLTILDTTQSAISRSQYSHFTYFQLTQVFLNKTI